MRNGSQWGSLGRIVWMAAGPACLLLSLVLIMNAPGAGWLTGPDMLYWAALSAMVIGRWTEYRGGDARNGFGEPTGRKDLARYFAGLAIVGPALWLFANFVSNNLMV
jgi:hypothetical protein